MRGAARNFFAPFQTSRHRLDDDDVEARTYASWFAAKGLADSGHTMSDRKPERCGEIEMGSVQDLAAFEQVEPVEHWPGGEVPFSDREDVAGAELVLSQVRDGLCRSCRMLSHESRYRHVPRARAE
jgi:hypothetical protein